MNQIQTAARSAVILSLCTLAASIPSNAQDGRFDHDRDIVFYPGNLVVSRSVYDNSPNNVKVGTVLPPNCASTTGGCSAATGAPYNGTYPQVFNNDIYDANFGVTSKIFLDQITLFGWRINSVEVPNSSQRHITSTSDQLVTSFSSKSEIALNLSTDGRLLTFMGYVSPIDAIDVSNSNTPAAVDPTDPVDRKSTRLNSSHDVISRMPSSA